MYGLKPVPFRLKPVPFKGRDTQDYFNKLLEQFSHSCALFSSVQGGFFLRKKPLIIVLSVYSNWRTAIARQSARGRCGSSGGAKPRLRIDQQPRQRAHSRKQSGGEKRRFPSKMRGDERRE